MSRRRPADIARPSSSFARLRRVGPAVAVLASFACDGGWPPIGTIDYLIVAGDDLVASARRYRAFREASGYTVETVFVRENDGSAEEVEQRVQRIRELVATRYEQRDPDRPFYLLLLGDANAQVPTGTHVDPFADRDVPSEITSDNLFADIDGDHIPDLAVGRIPAADDATVDLVRRKVEAYETRYEVGPWNRRLNVFASSANFGEVFDRLIDMFIEEVFESLSYDFDIQMTYGLEGSKYLFVPERFSERVYETINEGSLFTAFAGHGSVERLARLEWHGEKHPILDETTLDESLLIEHKSPIFAIVACWTGAFDDRDSLGERFVRHPHGPVATIASSEISHPYANAMLLREFAAVGTEQSEPTVGLLLRRTKERLVHQKDYLRDYLELITSLAFGAEQREALRRMHLHMYTLFGDPATRLQYVRGKVDMALSSTEVLAGGTLVVRAVFHGLRSGRADFTLELRRRELSSEILPIPADGDPRRDAVIEANYRAANEKVVLRRVIAFEGGRATLSLSIPPELPPGRYYVKVYAEDGVRDACGHQEVIVEQR